MIRPVTTATSLTEAQAKGDKAFDRGRAVDAARAIRAAAPVTTQEERYGRAVGQLRKSANESMDAEVAEMTARLDLVAAYRKAPLTARQWLREFIRIHGELP